MCSVDSVSMDIMMSNASDRGVTWTLLAELYPEVLISRLPAFVYQPWFCSMIGSILIGLSGIFPLLVIPIGDSATLRTGGGARTLNVLLSFAVGCLLGDVFLHLLPEVWSSMDAAAGNGHPDMNKGLWVLAGLMIFIILEKMFTFPMAGDGSGGSEAHSPDSTVDELGRTHNNNGGEKVLKKIGGRCKNGTANGFSKTAVNGSTAAPELTSKPIHVSGYLNLMANSFDNFTHGLAVGGSFLVSFPHGALTTAAILLHEIPHEVGDFAILLRSGFTRWEAARAQILTATAGMFGSLTAVMLGGAAGDVETRTSWILPFTAGGFLHIALVTVLPDLLKEENPVESLLQLTALLSGVGVMAVMASVAE